jgi:hypothetical protein
MKGWSVDGPPIFMPITRDVVLRTLPTAVVPKHPKRTRTVRGRMVLVN